MKQSSAMSDERPADDAALIERMARAIHADCLGEGAWVDEPMPDKFREVAKAALDAARSALNAELSERIEEVERLREALVSIRDFAPSEAVDSPPHTQIAVHARTVSRAALSTPSRGGHDAG